MEQASNCRLVSIHCVQGSYHLHDFAATIHFPTENSDQV